MAGLASMSWYYTGDVWTAEKFEMANPQLAIYKFHEFGLIPFLESFNSHALSELVNGFSYTFLNGYNGDFAMYNYEWVTEILITLAAYYLLKKFFNSTHLAFVTVLLIPTTFSVVNSIYPIIWFGVLAYYKAVEKKSVSAYARLLVHVLFSPFSGLSIKEFLFVLATIIVTILLIFIGKIGKQDIKPALIGLAWPTLALGLFTAIIVISKGIPLGDNFMKVWHYISSHQTWGYVQLGLIDEHFAMHYFLFPIASIACFGICLAET